MARVVWALSLLSMSACGMFLHHEPTEWEQAVERRPSSRVLEGEIRDAVTWTLVSDAAIEASTDVDGYEPLIRVEGGRFHLFVDTLRKRATATEQLMGQLVLGDLYSGDVKVREVAYRARAGTRCSPVQRHRVGLSPEDPVILWMRECDERELARRP